MSLEAAARGFIVFLLSVPVLQSQNGWRVTYSSIKVCALKGSTVDIGCTYIYPSSKNYLTTVEKTLWFTKIKHGEPLDLTEDPEYEGRVEYQTRWGKRILRITDLRESDSAEYRFRFITNQPKGGYTGSPGVTLTVTDLQVQVTSSRDYVTYTWAMLNCHSICSLAGRPSYVWFKNGLQINTVTSMNHNVYIYPKDSYACAVKGRETFHSPLVCIRDQRCNKVSYTNRRICALKGSSVDISCSYNSYEHDVQSAFWFNPDRHHVWRYSSPEDLIRDPEYAGRVQYPERTHSTLRITNLRESDSAEYFFKFITNSFDWRNDLPGTTLAVTDLKVKVTPVSVVTEGHRVIMTCNTSCPLTDNRTYIWYQNRQVLTQPESQQKHLVLDPVSSQHAGNYSCSVKNHTDLRSPEETLTIRYSPKIPSVSVSLSGEIEEGSSVTLTCSSDANPPAKYTWYKEKGDPDSRHKNTGQHLSFVSIQSSDSGKYYCAAQNDLGNNTSDSILVDVKYAPRNTSVLVSLSGEIEEGSSVTLTCSSDANPPAKYTWYKDSRHKNTGQDLSFVSIQSSDSGKYYCAAQNDLGNNTSDSILVDVKYAPKNTSVLVSLSGEIEEGSSVTLTCSSDANPPAKYTWYKENEDSPKASGQNYTITAIRSDHSGNYYCETHNDRGGGNSTLQSIVVTGTWTSKAVVGTLAVLLVVLLLPVFLWIRRKRASKPPSEQGGTPDNTGQSASCPLYGNISAMASRPAGQREPTEQQDDPYYASIHFSHSNDQEVSLCSAALPPRPQRGADVDYAVVKFKRTNASPGTGGQAAEGDPSALYSTVYKNKI
ncbi:B-cell receptor CD22-like [Polymixia lowei]